jgi:hypothetical protein
MKELLERIRAAEEVKTMVNSNGWKLFVKPLLDDMIKDVVGGQDGDRWISGQYKEDNTTGLSLSELMAYKQALIEFNEQVYGIIDDGEYAKEDFDNRRAQSEDVGNVQNL